MDKREIKRIVDETLTEFDVDRLEVTIVLADRIYDLIEGNNPMKRVGAEESLARSMSSSTSRFAHYNERYWPYLKVLVDPWGFEPPTKNEKNLYPGWIKSLNSIMANCAEYGPDLLVEIYNDYKKQERNGRAFSVFGPQSLINASAGKAAEKRRGSKTVQQNMFGEREVEIDGHKFTVSDSLF